MSGKGTMQPELEFVASVEYRLGRSEACLVLASSWFDVPRIVPSSSVQVHAPEKFFKALIRAVSVKNRIDGEISHPNRVIVIRVLQPLECVVFSV